MKISYVFSIFFFLAPLTWGQYKSTALDTSFIKGSISLDNTVFTLSGELVYTIQNKSNTPQNKWVILVNPTVGILTIKQNEYNNEIFSQIERNIRVLTVTLTSPLGPEERTSVTVRFSILPQNDDSRFTLGASGTFLDMRRLWFPLPDGNLDVPYEISVHTPPHLRAIMGGKLLSESTSTNHNISTWGNEIANLGLSGILIITDKPRIKQNDLYFYTAEASLQKNFQHFIPYWNNIKEKNNIFPLSELHLLPIDISIPGKGDDFADGEFLGNLFLVDNKLVSMVASNPGDSFYLSGSAEKRLTETLIHETFHSYLPGILRSKSDEGTLMESFIQYLTWSEIKAQNPVWSEEIGRRTRFLMLNMLSSKDTKNPLWKFLLGTSLFMTAFEQSSLHGLTLANTLTEKYRFIGLSLADIKETAENHLNVTTNEKIYTEFLDEFERTFLYNAVLQVINTNLLIVITNAKGEIIEAPLETSILRIQHSFPKEWTGTLSWNDGKQKNSISLTIPAGSIWVTNIQGKIVNALIKSPLDKLEQFLGDNTLPFDDKGYQLTTAFNNGSIFNNEYREKEQLLISDTLLNKLKRYKDYKYTFLWDNTENGEIQAYLVDSKGARRSFVSFIGRETGSKFNLLRLINPYEKQNLKLKSK